MTDGNGYKLLRNLMITVLAAFLIQIPAYVYYAGRLMQRYESLEESVNELKLELKRHTQDQGDTDNEMGRFDERINKNTEDIRENKQRIDRLARLK